MSKKVDKTLYTEDSIISLDPREFTRLRPSTYLGSNETSTQLLREIFSNALDEYLIGHGTKINIYIDTEKNQYKVEDFGQGFPINVVKDDETVLQAAFDKLNTSGKYSEDGVYGGSVLGLNGIGSKLCNYLSKTLEVYTSDGINYEQVWFKDGLFVKRETGEAKKKISGTKVTWKPDPQFFQDANVNLTDTRKLFEDIAALCPELTINLYINKELEVFHAKNGIQDLLDKKIGNKEILSNRFVVRKIADDNLFDISLTYTSDYSDNITAYVNYGLTESGIHISTVKSNITAQINKYANDNSLLGKKDDKLTSSELAEGLVIVFNLKANGVKYDSQTKVRIVDIDKSLINQVINNDFYDWLNNNPKDAKLIIDRALTARKAKEAAQKAKEGVRNAKTKGNKFISLPTKLVDAYSKDRSECEIFITEGDSAANGLIAKRDGKTQAIFPIRGKVLSCRKAPVEKIYANQEISNIVKALGLDIIKETGKLVYDTKKLRYNKIILATDADPDGYDIRLLLINVFWWLCPDLIMKGHIYAAVPPLYRITNKKNEYIYLTGDKELNEYKAKHSKESFLINRNKGLGESDSDELAYYLLKPETRNVRQIVADSYEDVDNLLETFMGDKVPPRRDYLLKHCNEVEVDTE